MQLDRTSLDRWAARPVILGAGLSGMAISRALSAAGVTHVLVGDRPTDAPRLGELLNAEGSLEITRQFPELARFFFQKHLVALFFGAHALSFDTIQYAGAPAYYPLLGYPPTVRLLHVDRIGFDRALFESVIADHHCLFAPGRVADVVYHPASDRIACVTLASRETIASTYVFDATNNARFVARKLGVRYDRIGEARRVVFAHYRPAGDLARELPPWMRATSLLRLDEQADPVGGLAWCIPLGDYVSVGISVDPARTRAQPGVLLDWVDKAYARRGIDVRGTFSNRGSPVDHLYEHYTHERCYGRNWLLAGPSCCQVWFHSAAGVATGFAAARLAPRLLKTPANVAALYQAYMDEVAASHPRLDWIVRDDPRLFAKRDLTRRAQGMIGANVKRLADYLSLRGVPAELAFGRALSRLYQRDRLMANPLRIDSTPPEAQATRLFSNRRAAAVCASEPAEARAITTPAALDGPVAILKVVNMLSGREDPTTFERSLASDLRVEIDRFRLRGIAQWVAWVGLLRGSTRLAQLELVAGALAKRDDQWVLTAQWQGQKGHRRLVSPEICVTFEISCDKVSAIRTRQADYAFVAGDSILPQLAVATMAGRAEVEQAA